MIIRNSIKKILPIIPIEALIWIMALGMLMFNDPWQTAGYSLCPFHNLGLDFCPGCGLGTSISLAFRGHTEASLNAHPFGILTIIILLYRIMTLVRRSYIDWKTIRQNIHG